MAVVEVISSTYTIENATVYERILNGNLLALRITPNSGYVLRWRETIDGETSYRYVGSYVQIATVQIATTLPLIDTIPREEVPEGFTINESTQPTETE